MKFSTLRNLSPSQQRNVDVVMPPDLITHQPHATDLINYLELALRVSLRFFIMKSVIVSIEGVNLTHRFVLRELSILFTEDDSLRHYFFNGPHGLHLTPIDKRTNYYTEKFLGGLGVSTHVPAALEAGSYRRILSSLGNQYRILCVGNVAHKFLTEQLPYADIWDLQSIAGLTFPKTLRTAYCGVSHPPRYCSLAKLWFMRNFVDATDIFMDE